MSFLALKKEGTAELTEAQNTKSFFDMVAPTTIRFMTDHYICGDSYRCAWAIRDYPRRIEQQGLLSHIADKSNVTFRIYTRKVEESEKNRIIQQAERKISLDANNSRDLAHTIKAEGGLQDITEMIVKIDRENEPFLYCAVYLELSARSFDDLRTLQSEVIIEMTRAKLTVDSAAQTAGGLHIRLACRIQRFRRTV